MTTECCFKTVSRVFDCGLCDFKCTVPNNFITHCKHNHGDFLPCKMCWKLYIKAHDLTSHIEASHHKLVFSCGNKDCCFVSPDRFAFEWHLTICNKNGFICIYCKSKFTTTENLFSHWKLSYTTNEEYSSSSKASVSCKQPCNKKLKRERSYVRKNGSLKDTQLNRNFSRKPIPILPAINTSQSINFLSTPNLNQNLASSQSFSNKFISESDEVVQIHLPELDTHPVAHSNGFPVDMPNILHSNATTYSHVVTDIVDDSLQCSYSLEKKGCTLIGGNSDMSPPKVCEASSADSVLKIGKILNPQDSLLVSYNFCVEKAGPTEFKVKSIQSNCLSSNTEREQRREIVFSLGEIEKLAEEKIDLSYKNPSTELVIKAEPIDDELEEMYETFSKSPTISSDINTIEERVFSNIKEETFISSDQAVTNGMSVNLKNDVPHDHSDDMEVAYLNQGNPSPVVQLSNIVYKFSSTSEDSFLSSSLQESISVKSDLFSEPLTILETKSTCSFSDRICLGETGILKLAGGVPCVLHNSDSSNDSCRNLVIDEDLPELQASQNIKNKSPDEGISGFKSETGNGQLKALITESHVEKTCTKTEVRSSCLENKAQESLKIFGDNNDNKIITFDSQLLYEENISKKRNSCSASQFVENIPNKTEYILQPIAHEQIRASSGILSRPVSLQNSLQKKVSFVSHPIYIEHSEEEIEPLDSESTDADLNSGSFLDFTSEVDTNTTDFSFGTFDSQDNTWQTKNSTNCTFLWDSNMTVRRILKKFKYKKQMKNGSKVKRKVSKRKSSKIMEDKLKTSERNLHQVKVVRTQFEHDISKLNIEQKPEENCTEIYQFPLASSSHIQNKGDEMVSDKQIASFAKTLDQNQDKAPDKTPLKECTFLENHTVQSRNSCKMFSNEHKISNQNENKEVKHILKDYLEQAQNKISFHEPHLHNLNPNQVSDEKLQEMSENDTQKVFQPLLKSVHSNSPLAIQPKFVPVSNRLLKHLPQHIKNAIIVSNPEPKKLAPMPLSKMQLQTIKLVSSASNLPVVLVSKDHNLSMLFGSPSNIVPTSMSGAASTTPTFHLNYSNVRMPDRSANYISTNDNNSILKNINTYSNRGSRTIKGQVFKITGSTSLPVSENKPEQKSKEQTCIVHPKATTISRPVDPPCDVSHIPTNFPSEINELNQKIKVDNKVLSNFYIQVVDSNESPTVGSNVQYLKYLKQQKSSSVLKAMSKSTDFFKCMFTTCPYTSNSPTEFKEHCKLHGDENVQCTYCLKIFSDSMALVEHSITDHCKRIFQCSLCFYRACSQMHVFAHLQACHKTQGMVMTGTPISIKSLAPVMDNIKMFVNIRNIYCPICTYQYFTKSITDMAYHMWKHTSVRRFQCFQCDFTCSSSLKWISHLNLHNIFLLHCFYCSFGCNKRLHMLNHLTINHADYPLMTYMRTSKHLFFNLECFLNMNENDILNCPNPSHCYCYLFLYHAEGDGNRMLKLLENIKTKNMHFKTLECLYCFRKCETTTKMEKHFKIEHCPSSQLQYYPCISQTLSNSDVRSLFISNKQENTDKFKAFLLYLKELKTGVMQEHLSSGKFEINSFGTYAEFKILLPPLKLSQSLSLPRRIILSFHNAFKFKWRTLHYSCDHCSRRLKTLYELRMHWKNVHVQNGKRFAYRIVHGLMKNQNNHKSCNGDFKAVREVDVHPKLHRRQLEENNFESTLPAMYANEINISNCVTKNFQPFYSRKRKSSSLCDKRLFKKRKFLHVEQPCAADNTACGSNASYSPKCPLTLCNRDITARNTLNKPYENSNSHQATESDTKSNCETSELKMCILLENYACQVKIPVQYLQNVINLKPSLFVNNMKDTMLNNLKKYYDKVK